MSKDDKANVMDKKIPFTRTTYRLEWRFSDNDRWRLGGEFDTADQARASYDSSRLTLGHSRTRIVKVRMRYLSELIPSREGNK